MTNPVDPAFIRSERDKAQGTRDRDFAASIGISEAQLVAAFTGQTATRISHHPDDVMPAVKALGEVMALTRNESCVHERVGIFEAYRSGPHAAMVTGPDIDTRIFPKHWAFGFAVEKEGRNGLARSLQFFDHAGDAVQKIHLRATSDLNAWTKLVEDLRSDDQSDAISVAPRPATEAPKINEEKRDILVDEWKRMTDTHQFNRLVSKLGMNRLGAYRLAGSPFVRKVAADSVAQFLDGVSAADQKVILFVGNRGNIQIHWGKLENIKPMGPWLNVMDEKFNLHLRGDHIAEVYVVEKPTKRGPAISLEAFDAEGGLIFQCFGQRKTSDDDLADWRGILDALPDFKET